MADDIFLTPEEQDERAKQWLKDNGLAIIVGIGLGIAAIVGFNNYRDGLQAKAEQASALYMAVADEFSASELSDIETQTAELKENYASTPYASKAALLKARQLAVSDLSAAYDELQWVFDNAPEVGLQHTARIRQAKIKLALGDLDAAEALANINEHDGFESHYQEILADINVERGNFTVAREQYQKAIDTLQDSDAGYASVMTIKMDRLPEDGDNEPAPETTSTASE